MLDRGCAFRYKGAESKKILPNVTKGRMCFVIVSRGIAKREGKAVGLQYVVYSGECLQMIFLSMMDTPEEQGKFAVLYEKYRHLMQQVAMNVLHDRFLAEDAVHNAFLKLSMHMADIGEPESRQTKRYLITIAKNAAIDIYRKKSLRIRREVYMDELGEDEQPMTYMETDTDNAVLDILKNLPIKYRDIFLLKYSAHLENGEIARLCGIQEGTVRQRIARGKRLIENELQKREDRDDEDKRD